MASALDKRRVKVYLLNEDGSWADQGTGHVTVQYLGSDVVLEVRSEVDGLALLESKIAACTNYNIQKEKLIVWQEPDDREFALSFQDESGCDDIWRQILQAGGRQLPQENHQGNGEDAASPANTEGDGADTTAVATDNAASDLPPLPAAEMGRLQEIEKYFEAIAKTRHDVLSKMDKTARDRLVRQCEDLATQMHDKDYVAKLLQLFHMCEDVENTEGLHHLFTIFNCLITLGNTVILQLLFEADKILHVIGTQEYDPEREQKFDYRQFLTSVAVFKEVVPFSDKALLPLIHQTYRMHYIKEVVLTNIVDDFLISAMSSLIAINNGEIVEKIKDDECFLVGLLTKLSNPAESEAVRVDCMKCLLELCRLASTALPDIKVELHKKLYQLGVFRIVEPSLASRNAALRTALLSVLTVLLEQEPNMRVTLVYDKIVFSLIKALCRRFVTESEPPLAKIYISVLQYILDTHALDTLQASPSYKADLLQALYDESCIGAMLELIEVPHPTIVSQAGKRERIEQLLEFLCFCVSTHGYPARGYFLRHAVLRRVAGLFALNSDILALTALKLLRAVLHTKDDFYLRQLIRTDFFTPLLQCLQRNGLRYNLLDSAMLEIFEYIRKENVKPLVEHLATEHATIIRNLDYVPTFRDLLIKHEQNTERPNGTPKPESQPDPRFRRDTSMPQEEENYFESDDDSAPALPSPAPAGTTTPQFRPRRPLVAYEDDDDEDDFLAKRKKQS